MKSVIHVHITRDEAPDYFHVTHTELVPKIKKEGIKPGKPSNWVRAANGRRYGNGEVNAFENETDARRWAAKMDWDFNRGTGTGKISIVRFDASEGVWHVDRKSDPLTQSSHSGAWLKSRTKVSPSSIKKVYPLTAAHARALVRRAT